MSETEPSNLPPLGTVTPGDHGGYLILAIYVTLCVTILFFTVRVIGRFQVSIYNRVRFFDLETEKLLHG